jgi:Uncharacterized protein required for cytochrome oxidase assembly
MAVGIRLRRLIAASTLLTGVLMVLGVYTAAAGAGLTCAGRWPFCDGYLGLFPANWSSFIEWFHRFVAMITGFMILGTAITAWRRGIERRIRVALAGATVLLPSQIILGALTVTTYEWVVLTAHFLTASLIFTGVVLATVWSQPVVNQSSLFRTGTLAVVAAPILMLLTPHAFIIFDPTVQSVYYGVGLMVYTALITVAAWAPTVVDNSISALRARVTASLAAVTMIILLIIGRQVYGGMLQYLSMGGTLIILALAIGATIILREKDTQLPSRGIPGSD